MKIMDMQGFRPADKGLAPMLFVEEGPEVGCHFVSDFDEITRLALAADLLHLGWRVDGYDAPIGDIETQREYRLVIWKALSSDAPMMPVENGDPE
jgi:hypothetical protein